MLLFVGCPLTSTITELNEVLDYLDKRIRHHLGITFCSANQSKAEYENTYVQQLFGN